MFNKIKKFITECPERSELIEYEHEEYDVKEILIPYSETEKYPVCEIKVHEGKIQMFGTYSPIFFQKAKKFFGSDMRNF